MAQILVIDDDSLVRRVIRRMLERVGHTVSEAADGMAGIEQQRRDPVDLALVDEQMPFKNGVETIRELRSEWPDLKLIVMSGERQYSCCEGDAIGDADGALDKPFSYDELLEVVKVVGHMVRR